MIPTLGWAGLSRSALKRAEAQLVGDSEGVRDEVGVLALHTGYANRFFPGTSVQQTRLRYALFVPWQIQALLKDERGVGAGQARAALERAELDLAKRLPSIEGQGTIGRMMAKQGKAVAIPPSQSYWVALGTWGILASQADGSTPSRAELFSRWVRWPDGRQRRPESDDERRALEAARRLFAVDLPGPPPEFVKGRPLDFTLLPLERRFFMKRLKGLRRFDGAPSYLACLARNEVCPSPEQTPWSAELISHADEKDRAALNRARQAAALSVIARALYYAAVEGLLDERDGRRTGTGHRERLEAVLAEYSEAALELDLSAVETDRVELGALGLLLAAMQSWVRSRASDPWKGELHSAMSLWEMKRKGQKRSKLALSNHGAEARAIWSAAPSALAVPINYRWDLVRRLLGDLGGK